MAASVFPWHATGHHGQWDLRSGLLHGSVAEWSAELWFHSYAKWGRLIRCMYQNARVTVTKAADHER